MKSRAGVRDFLATSRGLSIAMDDSDIWTERATAKSIYTRERLPA